jgi:hypothetical protein
MRVERKEGIGNVRISSHNRVLFYIIILLFIVLIGIWVYVAKHPEPECNADSDCVPSDCCHAISCTAKNNSPDCEGVMCTMNCEPGTLDCGGSCVCQNNKCAANLK